MKEILVIIVEIVEEKGPSIGALILLLIILMTIGKCNNEQVPPPINNSGFEFEKESKTIPEPRISSRNTISNRPKIENNLDREPTQQHNIYYCTLHEKYFKYNEQTAHYDCKNAIKKINIKFCMECQEHFGPAEQLNHFGHFEVPYDSQKQFYKKFYCNICGFDHFSTVLIN